MEDPSKPNAKNDKEETNQLNTSYSFSNNTAGIFHIPNFFHLSGGVADLYLIFSCTQWMNKLWNNCGFFLGYLNFNEKPENPISTKKKKGK